MRFICISSTYREDTWHASECWEYNKRQIASVSRYPDMNTWRQNVVKWSIWSYCFIWYWLLSSSVETALFPRAEQIYFHTRNSLICMWWANIFHQNISEVPEEVSGFGNLLFWWHMENGFRRWKILKG